MIWPVHLCAIYAFPEDIASLLPAFLGGLAAILVSALLAIYFWKRDRRVCFGFVWFFVTLAPVLNVRWMPAIVFSERYLYLPSVGFCWVAAWLAVRVWEAATRARLRLRPALVAAACGLGLLLAARIVARNPNWKDDLTFYRRTLAASPDSAIVRNNLGLCYAEQGNLKAAGEQWNAALKLMPNAPFVLNNLGFLNRMLKRYREAAVFYERSLAISPRDQPAHTGLGEVYQSLGMRQQAESELLQAVALAPLDVEARVHLGQLYCDEGQYAQAEKEFETSLRSLPSVRGYTGLAVVHWAQGDHAGAQRLFAAAIRLDPTDSRPYVMQGALDAASGRVADAIREFEVGLKLDPTNEGARAQLAKLQHQQ
jgi:protein O-mannosyl-transferase